MLKVDEALHRQDLLIKIVVDSLSLTGRAAATLGARATFCSSNRK